MHSVSRYLLKSPSDCSSTQRKTEMLRLTPDGDGNLTPTSREQRETEARISKCFPPPNTESMTAIYTLDCKARLYYVARTLFPRHYVYQAIVVRVLLGTGLDPDNKQR